MLLEIWTDTPNRKELEEEEQKKKEKLAKELVKKKGTKKTLVKPKRVSKKIVVASSDEEEDVNCIYCLELYSSSRDNEKWVRCSQCDNWGHEKCAKDGNNPFYVCPHCDSDDDC